MADTFHDTDGLVDAVAAASFDRPPALVANAHITGVSVARALDAHDVPVIALDRNGDGVAPTSDAVAFAGAVTYPLDDADGFRADVERVADAAGTDCVAFACMDEWVRGFAETEPEGVRRPFSDAEGIERVLDKANLYALCEELGVPYPETYRVGETPVDEAAEALGFPLVVKPAHKRKFEEAFGTNVIEVEDRDELHDTVAAADEADATVLLQEKVPVETGADTSLASYVPPEGGEPLAVVGNAAVRFPRGFGTSCLVETVDEPAVRERALSVLEETGYHGISESEFVYDQDREEYVLLDINTRPWKWISMTVEAGANLPMAAYASVTDAEYEPEDRRDARWVYLRDYLNLATTDPTFWDVLSREEWTSLVSGAFESERGLTTGVYRPSDPGPTAAVIETELTDREYYCSC
ncbi:carboxylate--amine ligase [Candidatus Halobonum tyrrellensis]|uniref:ATP-grasp protein-like protein n=1 Tax=Candidatus Halobonum tyrrellensis G22 TaxID=1324957 RepID=V4IYF9_9EURY|nr:ATP-grasp protein [Candidatus Halobonum tyrrellensis]ESP88177.1 ATP-grasp protein-like protein [Candidatus Halobonum tyrrellensis G22]